MKEKKSFEKPIRMGILMDPIQTINPLKDTSLAFMLEAQARGWQVLYMEMADICLRNGRAEGRVRLVKVFDDHNHWFEIEKTETVPLGELDFILMRKDPPFDIEFIMATYILERAELEGAKVINRPQSLRDVNEKVFTAWFPQCCPPSLLSRSKNDIISFLEIHQKIVLKPTCKMGGQSIFVVQKGDPNSNVIIEELSCRGTQYIQAQAYISDIKNTGDKRIILINGVPIENGIARIPGEDDHRGNLAVGATAEGFSLSKNDRWICEQIGPTLKKKGLVFVGIDVIGNYLTEINVTSPTGIREINKLFHINIASIFMDELTKMLPSKEV
ncbi:MAG: glutathione synthase [Bacteroidia bacterium]